MLRVSLIILRLFMMCFIDFLHYHSPYAINEDMQNLIFLTYCVFTTATLLDLVCWYASVRMPLIMQTSMYLIGSIVFAYDALINLQFFVFYENKTVSMIGLVKSHLSFITSLLYALNFIYMFTRRTALAVAIHYVNIPPPAYTISAQETVVP